MSGVLPPDENAIIWIAMAMIEGTNRMKTKVRIDAELDFLISELKSIAMPVSARMYSMQYPIDANMLDVNPPVLIAIAMDAIA